MPCDASNNALGCVFTPGLQFDGAEKRVLHLASIYARIPVGCAPVTLRTRFIAFAARAAHSRPVVNTHPSAYDGCRSVAMWRRREPDRMWRNHSTVAWEPRHEWRLRASWQRQTKNAAKASQAQSVAHRKVHRRSRRCGPTSRRQRFSRSSSLEPRGSGCPSDTKRWGL